MDMKPCIVYTALILAISFNSCGNEGNKNTGNTTDSAVIGGEPARPSDATDLSKTGVDSLRNTTDVKADTPGMAPSKTPQNNTE